MHYVSATCGKKENRPINPMAEQQAYTGDTVLIRANNSIIYLFIVNGWLPLSLFIYSVDGARMVAMDASSCLVASQKTTLRLEHGVRHLAFGQVWAEFCRSRNVHLLI